MPKFDEGQGSGHSPYLQGEYPVNENQDLDLRNRHLRKYVQPLTVDAYSKGRILQNGQILETVLSNAF